MENEIYEQYLGVMVDNSLILNDKLQSRDLGLQWSEINGLKNLQAKYQGRLDKAKQNVKSQKQAIKSFIDHKKKYGVPVNEIAIPNDLNEKYQESLAFLEVTVFELERIENRLQELRAKKQKENKENVIIPKGSQIGEREIDGMPLMLDGNNVLRINSPNTPYDSLTIYDYHKKYVFPYREQEKQKRYKKKMISTGYPIA